MFNKLLRLKEDTSNTSNYLEDKYINKEQTRYPDGCFLIAENNIWYIKGGLRFKITSDTILESWSPPCIGSTTEAVLSSYKIGGKLGFRPGSLINNIADGKLYYIEGSKRRHICTPLWLRRLGLELHDAIVVSDDEAKLHAEGEPLD